MEARWLRWSTLSGTLLPTSQEVAAEVQRQAAEAKRQADAMATLLNRYRERFGDLQE